MSMERIIYYGAYLFSLLQILVVLFVLKDAYGRDMFFAALLFVPPIFTILALRAGPDAEERKLAATLRKARLQMELDSISKR